MLPQREKPKAAVYGSGGDRVTLAEVAVCGVLCAGYADVKRGQEQRLDSAANAAERRSRAGARPGPRY